MQRTDTNTLANSYNNLCLDNSEPPSIIWLLTVKLLLIFYWPHHKPDYLKFSSATITNFTAIYATLQLHLMMPSNPKNKCKSYKLGWREGVPLFCLCGIIYGAYGYLLALLQSWSLGAKFTCERGESVSIFHYIYHNHLFKWLQNWYLFSDMASRPPSCLLSLYITKEINLRLILLMEIICNSRSNYEVVSCYLSHFLP